MSVYTNGATTKIPNHSYFVCRVATPKTKTYFYIHVSPAPKVHGHFILVILSYDLTDTAGVLENKVLGMFHGLDDKSLCKSDLKCMQEIARR